jgi:hypothetical protein
MVKWARTVNPFGSMVVEQGYTVQIVQPLRFVQSLFFIFPRVAGEERDGGLERLKRLERFEPVCSPVPPGLTVRLTLCPDYR